MLHQTAAESENEQRTQAASLASPGIVALTSSMMGLHDFGKLRLAGPLAWLVSIAAGTTPAAAMVGPASAAADPSPQDVMILFHQGAIAGFCSGIVLAQDVVLTAAHCVPKGADIRVHLPGGGAAPVMLPVIGVTRHPDYHADAIKMRERSIDLGLVHLAKPLPERFRPVALARSVGTKVGARFEASGYGVAREGEAASSGTLRTTVLTARAPLSNVLLWAEDPSGAGAGACTGDSGGPVTAEGSAEISALILWSAGESGRQCGGLTQALWLAPHRAWIERVTKAWTR